MSRTAFSVRQFSLTYQHVLQPNIQFSLNLMLKYNANVETLLVNTGTMPVNDTLRIGENPGNSSLF